MPPPPNHDRAPGERSGRSVRLLAYFGAPSAIVAALALSWWPGLSAAGRVGVVFGGGALAALALIAPWWLSRGR